MPVAFVDWFPCVFMRGTPAALALAFPGWRVPLSSPTRRRRASPFGDGSFHEYWDWDPDPVEAPDAHLPSRPPLPYAEFRTGDFWYEEYPMLYSLLTGASFDDGDVPWFDQMWDRQLIRPALYRRRSDLGEGLRLYMVPGVLRDALHRLEEADIERLARRWMSASGQAAPPKPVDTVRGLVELSRAAVKVEEHLFIWDDHR